MDTRKKLKKKTLVVLLTILMILSTLPTQVFARDEYNTLAYTPSSSFASVQFAGVFGSEGIIGMSFNEIDNDYGVFCIDVSHEAHEGNNYYSEALGTYFSSATTAGKVRNIISKSVADLSASEVLSALGVAVSDLPTVDNGHNEWVWVTEPYPHYEQQWVSDIATWNDLTSTEQIQVAYAAAQAALWSVVEGYSSPTFNFSSGDTSLK